MKKSFALILALVLVCPIATPQTRTHSKTKLLVHLVAINMSGAPRELIHGRDVVMLPVAERVPLQIRAGDSIQITSQTNTKIREVIAILATDEGRIITIH